MKIRVGERRLSDSRQKHQIRKSKLQKGSRHKSGASAWTFWSTVGTWTTIAGTVVGTVLTATWYAAKADSTITNVQTDVGELKRTVERLQTDLLLLQQKRSTAPETGPRK